MYVQRSKVATHNPILWDSGRASQHFFPPNTRWFGKEVIPADNKWFDGTPSFMAPVSHYHLLQEEKFHVESGSGLWYLNSGLLGRSKTIPLKKGDKITIPKFTAHRFENTPGSTDPLVILYRYDPQMYTMERRFFSNTLTYLDDCRTQNIQPSLCQLCLMLSDCWMPGEFLWVPGPEWLRCLVNALFMWTFALIGRVVFGMRGSYVEYFDEEVVRREGKRESGKGK